MGSTFTIRLSALEAEDIQMQENEEPLGTTQDMQSRRVLVVDDAAGIAKITARLFTMLGHKPMIALNGKSAIEVFREYTPEIVVLDLLLPDMSGFDVARAIREIDVENRTLIAAQTGNTDSENRRKAEEAGFDEYLVKPVDVAELKKLGTHRKLPQISGTH